METILDAIAEAIRAGVTEAEVADAIRATIPEPGETDTEAAARAAARKRGGVVARAAATESDGLFSLRGDRARAARQERADRLADNPRRGSS